MQRKIIITNHQSLGDIAVLTAAVRDLVKAHGDKFLVDAQTNAPAIWDFNPHLTPLDKRDPEVEFIEAEYPQIQQSNSTPVHFLTSFHAFLEQKLDVRIPAGPWGGSIYIGSEETAWYSAVYEELGYDPPYWVIDAGYKRDFTAKQWEHARFQAVVDALPHITFVQIGLAGNPHHVHKPLEGPNVINMLGKTNDRQLIRLIYNAYGVITPVSAPMVLAYLIPPHQRFSRKARACVVIAGGREPNTWQQGPGQQFLHTCGMLDCCDKGGCWKSRITVLGDNDEKDKSLCLFPVSTPSGQTIARCMDMISAEDVIKAVKGYADNLEYAM